MEETAFGYTYDVSYEPQSRQDCIYIDTGLDTQIYLTAEDLESMTKTLAGYLDE
jgi:hypothetical protein